jgi:long-chain acyl-CoA synthetase
MNLGSLGADNIQKYGPYQSIYYEGKWFTNVEMEAQSNKLGNALKSLGIQRGDRVAIQMPNSPVVIWSFSSIYKIGAIAVPMNPLLRPDQAAYIYQNCGAKAVVTSPEFAPGYRLHKNRPPNLNILLSLKKKTYPTPFFMTHLYRSNPTASRSRRPIMMISPH